VARSIVGYRCSLIVTAAIMVLAASCTSSYTGDAAVTEASTAASLSTTPTANSSTTASAAPTTTLSATSTTSLVPIDRLDSGLSCDELAALGYSYVAAIRYWEREGVPDRLDADWDGIPCETAWPHDDVAVFWGEPLPDERGGSSTESCINGWTTPVPGSEERKWALDRVRDALSPGPDDHVVVLALRYFVGPEDVDYLSERSDVERWYIEARSRRDPSNAVRWLGRRTSWSGSIVCWKADPYTTGFEVGTWRATECSGKDPFEVLPACLPDNGPFCQCEWDRPGCSCANGENDQLACTGPPPQVMGCLADL
jgi:hypothetical protein